MTRPVKVNSACATIRVPAGTVGLILVWTMTSNPCPAGNSATPSETRLPLSEGSPRSNPTARLESATLEENPVISRFIGKTLRSASLRGPPADNLATSRETRSSARDESSGANALERLRSIEREESPVISRFAGKTLRNAKSCNAWVGWVLRTAIT